VADESPADRAGISPGDIILRFGGRPVKTIEELRRNVMSRKVGDSVQVTVARGEERVDIETTLEEIP
jgi:S1-C subfamily serine protease